MKKRLGAVVAAGALCAVAATSSLWSAALASASGALHTGAVVQVPGVGHVHHGSGPVSNRSSS